MSVPYFYRNTNVKFISVEGDDSSTFLQNLITNDINKCNNENILYSCLLSPQGKFTSDFFIFKKDNKFILETSTFYYDKLVKKLNLYKLRSKILIKEVDGLNSFYIYGNIEKDKDAIIFYNDPRSIHIGIKLIHESDKPVILTGIKEINESSYHKILIRNTVPLSHYDLEENKSLLLENNFDNLNSISWDKGCYIGQEITARMKYRALLKKKIYTLKIKVGFPEKQQIISENGNELGKIISIREDFVLAMLKINILDEKILKNKNIKTDDDFIFEVIT